MGTQLWENSLGDVTKGVWHGVSTGSALGGCEGQAPTAPPSASLPHSPHLPRYPREDTVGAFPQTLSSALLGSGAQTSGSVVEQTSFKAAPFKEERKEKGAIPVALGRNQGLLSLQQP